jgi:hypothetical protein
MATLRFINAYGTASSQQPTNAEIVALRGELAKLVGKSATAATGDTYKVEKKMGLPTLFVMKKGEKRFSERVETRTRLWANAVNAAMEASKIKSSTPTKTTRTGGKTTGTTTTPTTDTSWTTKPKIAEVQAISGWKGPSTTVPNVSYEVSTIYYGSLQGPLIAVATAATSTSAASRFNIFATSANWEQYATDVIASKVAAPAGTSGSSSDTSAGAGGTSAPAWSTQPYLNEMLAISGWTGPSFNMPSVTLTVKSSTLDGVAAPVIGVTSSTGEVEVTPAMAEWSGYASNVIASKAEDDQRKASGTPSPSTAVAATAANPDEGRTIVGPAAPAQTFQPSEPVAPAEVTTVSTDTAPVTPAGATTVSTDTTPAVSEDSFLSKNKWYVAGGAVALLGGYAYLHRMNPEKYPLPDYLSKMVR